LKKLTQHCTGPLSSGPCGTDFPNHQRPARSWSRALFWRRWASAGRRHHYIWDDAL